MNDSQLKLHESNVGDKFSVRKGTPADAGVISALLTCAFVEFKHLYTPEAFVATVLPETDVLGRLEEGPLWVAEKQAAVIGTVGAICMPDSLMVRGMAVNPEGRGLGIGKALLRVSEDFAQQQGYDRLSLYTTAFLHRAIHLYQSSGFRFTGETANPHGTELLRMEKALGGQGKR